MPAPSPTAKALSVLILALSTMAASISAEARLYKCQGPRGIEYRDHPCTGGSARPVSEDRVTVISGDSLTGRSGRSATPADKRPAWIKDLAPDPIGDCKARGGAIDRELRACVIP